MGGMGISGVGRRHGAEGLPGTPNPRRSPNSASSASTAPLRPQHIYRAITPQPSAPSSTSPAGIRAPAIETASRLSDIETSDKRDAAIAAGRIRRARRGGPDVGVDGAQLGVDGGVGGAALGRRHCFGGVHGDGEVVQAGTDGRDELVGVGRRILAGTCLEAPRADSMRADSGAPWPEYWASSSGATPARVALNWLSCSRATTAPR